MLIRTGSKEVHWHPQIAVNGPTIIRLYEDAFYSVAGTSLTAYNYNRSFNTFAINSSSYAATVSSGTQIWGTLVVGVTASTVRAIVAVGGSAESPVEFILKPNANYHAQMINVAETEQMVSYNEFFYEE